jgi:hypothetical protein
VPIILGPFGAKAPEIPRFAKLSLRLLGVLWDARFSTNPQVAEQTVFSLQGNRRR